MVLDYLQDSVIDEKAALDAINSFDRSSSRAVRIGSLPGPLSCQMRATEREFRRAMQQLKLAHFPTHSVADNWPVVVDNTKSGRDLSCVCACAFEIRDDNGDALDMLNATVAGELRSLAHVMDFMHWICHELWRAGTIVPTSFL